MARVVYRDENFQTYYVDVNDQQPEVTIGRNQGNMVLIAAKSLSRYHAKIIYQNRRYFLIDLKSSNGSYVNNQRIGQQYEIHPGDKLRFGDVNVDFVDDNRAMMPVNQPVISSPPPISAHSLPPVAPAGIPKPSGPKVQMFNPGLQAPAGPDLRNVNVRPISSAGNYRPTMPNQPSYDDDMAKMMAEQSNHLPPAGGLDAAAAPASFDPNSMGIRPIPSSQPVLEPAVPAILGPGGLAGGAARNMMAAGPGPSGMDPSLPPASFNPNSMGMMPGSGSFGGSPSLGAPSVGPASLPPSQFAQSSGSGMPNVSVPSGSMNAGEMGMMPGISGASPVSVPSSASGIPVAAPDNPMLMEDIEEELRAEGTSVSSREQLGLPPVEDESASDSASGGNEDSSLGEARASSESNGQVAHVRRNVRANSGKSVRGVPSRARVSSHYPMGQSSDSSDIQELEDVVVEPAESDGGSENGGSADAGEEPAAQAQNAVEEHAPESENTGSEQDEKAALEPETKAPEVSESESEQESGSAQENAPEPVRKEDAPNAEEVGSSEKDASIQELDARLKEVNERADDYAQTIELLNAAMTELKEHHAKEMAELKEAHEAEISKLNLTQLQELGKLRAEYEDRIQASDAKVAELEKQNIQMNGDLISLQAKIVEMEETGCAALTMVPKWSARFDALVQYSKALERAVEKLGMDSVEPKAIEYVRSMGDMVRYCADELKKESEKENAKKEDKEDQEDA